MLLDTLTDIYGFFLDNLKTMLETNLLVTPLARAVFVFFFILDYATLVRGKGTSPAVEEARTMRRSDWAWFLTKEILFVGLGFVHLALAIAVVGYSLMLSGSHLVACARRSKFKVNLVLAWIVAGLAKYAVPVVGVVAAVAMICLDTDPSAWSILVGASVAIAAFLARSSAGLALRRLGPREFSMETALKAAKRRIARKTPLAFKVMLLTCIVGLPAGFTIYIEANVGIRYWTESIETPDGAQLSTDVYRLWSAAGPQPVLLLRTPYDKGDLVSTGKDVYPLLLQGYTVVCQDTRGRYASSGKAVPFVDDARDGALTVSWIGDQPWCDGNVASYGGSACAITQYLCADEPTGALKFQTLIVGSPEYHDHVVYQGGAFRKGLLETWIRNSMYLANEPRRSTEYSDALAWYFGHQLKDAAWNSTSLSMNDRYAGVKASALHVGGWYDIFSQGTIDGFVGYNYHGGPGAAGKQRLVMGPVGHGQFGVMSDFFNHASSLSFREGDTSGHAGWEAEMRDAAIKGTPINWSGPCVAYFLMGDAEHPTAAANKWHYADQWPVPHVNTTYYFHGNGTLGSAAAASNQTVSYLYDPANPVPTRGGNNLNQIATLEGDGLGIPAEDDPTRVLNFEGIGPYDQQRAGNIGRCEVILFETEPLAAPLSVVGRVSVNLWVASNCTDTAFTAMLLDRYEDGRCYNVLDGIQVMRYREGPDHVATGMAGGQYYRVSVDLWSTAWQFNTNHRIGIAISSSNYPRFERHPNNSLPLTNHPGSFNVANNTVLCGAGAYNASVVLPTVAL
ncbi:MAG: CocE/NonD family hydrolase [Candidatus Lokiarchaeota archaeon]|nr:CocE/NonD family hydrolase [Candidatus Lokiarchaeota archaeon]